MSGWMIGYFVVGACLNLFVIVMTFMGITAWIDEHDKIKPDSSQKELDEHATTSRLVLLAIALSLTTWLIWPVMIGVLLLIGLWKIGVAAFPKRASQGKA